MTKVVVNKTTADFNLSRRAYNRLIQNYGWRHIGVIDMNRETNPLSTFIDANDDPITPVVNTVTSVGGTVTRRGGNTPALKIGDNVTYDFAPTSEKYAKQIIIDGHDAGSGELSYTFSGLNDNHNLEVIFADTPTLQDGEHTIDIFCTDGGDLTGSLVTAVTPAEGDPYNLTTDVKEGGTYVMPAADGTFTLSAKPFSGYVFDSITVDGTPIDISGFSASTPYTVNFTSAGLTANTRIAIYFRPTATLDIPVLRSTKMLWQDLYGKYYMSVSDRSDADLVACVETLQAGSTTAADGEDCKIKIIEIPNEIIAWVVKRNCEGLEIVTTPYQVWEE